MELKLYQIFCEPGAAWYINSATPLMVVNELSRKNKKTLLTLRPALSLRQKTHLCIVFPLFCLFDEACHTSII